MLSTCASEHVGEDVKRLAFVAAVAYFIGYRTGWSNGVQRGISDARRLYLRRVIDEGQAMIDTMQSMRLSSDYTFRADLKVLDYYRPW